MVASKTLWKPNGLAVLDSDSHRVGFLFQARLVQQDNSTLSLNGTVLRVVENTIGEQRGEIVFHESRNLIEIVNDLVAAVDVSPIGR